MGDTAEGWKNNTAGLSSTRKPTGVQGPENLLGCEKKRTGKELEIGT